MPSYYWIKLYIEILYDPKMALLSDRLWRRVIELFLIAGEYNKNGKLPELKHIAWTLRIDVEMLETELVELQQTGILSVEDGRWYVTKFADRQKAISVADRVKQHRERQKKQEYYDTHYKGSNEDVTIRYTDIDIDKETDVEGESNQPFSHLQTAFINATGIPDFGMKPKAVEAGRRMMKAGVTPEDIEQAVIELGDNYTIIDLSSVENASYNVMRKRNKKVKIPKGYTHG